MAYITHTSAYWTSSNPILNKGDIGAESNTGVQKVGDGLTAWNSLAYVDTPYEYTSASGTDTYVASLEMLNVLDYFSGQRIRVKFTNANTGAATINVNGLGAKSIKKNVSSALVSGDILAGAIHHLIYDGTNFQVENGVGTAGVVPTLSQVLTAGSDGDYIAITELGNITNTSGVDSTILYNNSPGYWQAYIHTNSGTQNAYIEIYKNGTTPYVYLQAADGAVYSGLEVSETDVKIQGSAGFKGATYVSDYSANYTARSLIDKGYAAATFAPIGSGVTSVNSATGAVTLTHTTAQGVSGTWTGTALALTLGVLTGVTSLNGLVITANTGTITTGTWNASLIGLAYGGTNKNMTAVNGGIVWTDADSMEVSAAGSSGQILMSGGAAAPTWSTATYPATATTTGAYLRADGTNWITSTLILPNAATSTRVVYASAANTYGESANLTFDGNSLTVGTSVISPIMQGSTSASGSLTLRATSNATDGAIIFQSDSTTERARILSTGELLVGSTAVSAGGESWAFTKNQNAASYLTIFNTTSGTAGYSGLAITNSSTISTSLFLGSFSAAYTTSGIFVADTGLVNSSKTGGLNVGCFANAQVSFWTNNTKRVEISAVGNVSIGGVATRGTTVGTNAMQIFDGTAPVGTLTNGCSFYSSSGNPTVMNSAGTGWALPYYAQGTFTPVVTLTGAGTAPQYTTASGTYTRNGRTCFFNILLSGDGGNEGSGAGVITITLPFSTSADQLAITVQGGISNNGGTENLLYYVLTGSSSTLTLKRQQSATQLTDFTGADQNNTTRSIQIMGKILV